MDARYLARQGRAQVVADTSMVIAVHFLTAGLVGGAVAAGTLMSARRTRSAGRRQR